MEHAIRPHPDQVKRQSSHHNNPLTLWRNLSSKTNCCDNLGDFKQQNNVAQRCSQFAVDNDLNHLEHMACSCRMSWLLCKCILSLIKNLNARQATCTALLKKTFVVQCVYCKIRDPLLDVVVSETKHLCWFKEMSC